MKRCVKFASKGVGLARSPFDTLLNLAPYTGTRKLKRTHVVVFVIFQYKMRSRQSCRSPKAEYCLLRI